MVIIIYYTVEKVAHWQDKICLTHASLMSTNREIGFWQLFSVLVTSDGVIHLLLSRHHETEDTERTGTTGYSNTDTHLCA